MNSRQLCNQRTHRSQICVSDSIAQQQINRKAREICDLPPPPRCLGGWYSPVCLFDPRCLGGMVQPGVVFEPCPQAQLDKTRPNNVREFTWPRKCSSVEWSHSHTWNRFGFSGIVFIRIQVIVRQKNTEAADGMDCLKRDTLLDVQTEDMKTLCLVWNSCSELWGTSAHMDGLSRSSIM